MVIIFFSLQCSVFCQQVFFSFSYVCTVFFSHFLACFLLPNKLSIFLESNAFPMLSQAGFTLESRLAALLGETFLSPVTSTLSACGTCRKKQKTKKKNNLFKDFFFFSSIQHRNGKQGLPTGSNVFAMKEHISLVFVIPDH